MNNEQRRLFNKLTNLQKSVALEKYGDPTISDYEAYVRAKGGPENITNRSSASTSVHEIMTNHDMDAFMSCLTKTNDEQRINEKILSRTKMLEDLTIIANASLLDICQMLHVDDELMNVESGELYTGLESFTLKKLSDIAPEHLKLITSVEMGKYGLKVKLPDPMQARKMIAEMNGYNAPVKSETHLTGNVDISDEELSEKLNKLGIGRKHDQLAGKVE